MKKITIGRNNACDIVIPDTSDLVSRKQAVLVISFFGKMTLYDTSNNGTFVNGQHLENGKGVQVTRKDKVNFARIADLDWNEVKDPYKKEKALAMLAAIVFLVISVLIAVCSINSSQEENPPAVETVSTPVKGDVKTTVQENAAPTQSEAQPVRHKKHKKIKNQKKRETKPVKKIETNDQSPIIY